jgi:hypothetical protein
LNKNKGAGVIFAKSLKSRMAMTTAMLAVIGGYSRRAYAQCALAAGTYTCGGTITTTQNLSGTPLRPH